ncbi:MAG TPA: pyrroline-5-carboxylate reductase [Acidiferrobacterales bacterium]|nr:pyrroline-5-carboxylate reductase [Acidiferrobacterales bacterium]
MTQGIIGFIGAGNMARSLVGGLLHNGWEKSRLILSDPDKQQRQAVEKTLGVTVYSNNNEVTAQADILVLAVKPQILQSVSQELAAAVQKKRPLIISIAAGIRVDDLQYWLGGGLAIVRAMPNTPALIAAGSSGLFANTVTSELQRDQAESILRAVGIVVWLPEERLLDVVTALSGSGPAYFFLIMEALEQAAIELGLAPDIARLLTLETAYGAAKMALEDGEDPAILRQRVTSPGGTTERALQVLEQGQIRRLFNNALHAARQRAGELADLFGKSR